MWPAVFSSTRKPVPVPNLQCSYGMMSGPDPRAALSVLVVEDDRATREALGLLLARRFPDAAIHSAENGRKGVELFEAHAPDIVITDIAMPVMDGIRMAEEIKARSSDATFIVITAYGSGDYLNKFSEIGFCDYLTKPIDFAKLFAAIEKCLAGKTSGKA